MARLASFACDNWEISPEDWDDLGLRWKNEPRAQASKPMPK